MCATYPQVHSAPLWPTPLLPAQSRPAWDYRNHDTDCQQAGWGGFTSLGEEKRQIQRRDKATRQLEVVRQNNGQGKALSRLSWYLRDYLCCLNPTVWTRLIWTGSLQVFRVLFQYWYWFFTALTLSGEEEGQEALIIKELHWWYQRGARWDLLPGQKWSNSHVNRTGSW